ncbi:MAG: TRAP transporter small permease subunit [Rhizobiales bacterium]|nr:TRAP transporter small permease subunit [Hyphomicrobiales bacterium]
MLKFAKGYIRIIEKMNYVLGRFAMYLIFVIMGILLWSSVSKTFFLPSLWTLETAQFAMVAYYMLGGPYSLQMGSNVRMDLFYGDWSITKKALVDAFTIFFLLFYLCVLLYGGYQSTEYALRYGERSATAWRPYMAPIKITMCVGIFMMILQAVAELFKDIATVRGVKL